MARRIYSKVPRNTHTHPHTHTHPTHVDPWTEEMYRLRSKLTSTEQALDACKALLPLCHLSAGPVQQNFKEHEIRTGRLEDQLREMSYFAGSQVEQLYELLGNFDWAVPPVSQPLHEGTVVRKKHATKPRGEMRYWSNNMKRHVKTKT